MFVYFIDNNFLIIIFQLFYYNFLSHQQYFASVGQSVKEIVTFIAQQQHNLHNSY